MYNFISHNFYDIASIAKATIFICEFLQVISPELLIKLIISHVGGPGRDLMVFGIFNYLCNLCLAPPKMWVRIPLIARWTRYNIIWANLSPTCFRSVVFAENSGTDCQDLTEILLQVALNTIALPQSFLQKFTN